ncbi:MAG: GNAT family N-acetyltransferase [Candidatus Cloacimonetes bacterium]|nr:GNAT family N-acetyltransferase [Candidatus Cloacimonadota bacterium]
MYRISIVEFCPYHAKAVAEMLNSSSEGWHGRIFSSSEAKVLQKETSTKYHNLYLAMQDEQVLGYAKLTNYVEEEGVAYIELLSVLPTHHGQGIGRDLVKKCVLRAAELGYNRIDLFTWAGNTKAVPLYKKCGFFWEKMDNQSTHLMNFLPGLLNMEFLKPIWEKLDWYEDSRRELKIEPDGRRKNGFDLYDYIWEKDGLRLEISFERFGRGIVAIKTPDYSIELSTDQAKPVFGMPGSIFYHLQKASSEPITLILEGIDDANLSHSFRHEALWDNALELISEYYPAPLKRKLHEWETCPRAKSMLRLNGMELPLAIGLKIQYPLTVNLRAIDSLCIPHSKYCMYLNVENHFPQACKYHIQFPEDKNIRLKEYTFSVELQGRACDFIELEYSATQSCIYNPHIRVEALPEGGKPISFEVECYCTIHCPSGRQGIDTPEATLLVNAMNDLQINKLGTRNNAWLGHMFCSGVTLLCPQAGKPYSEELEAMLPSEILIRESQDAIEVENRFSSKDIPGLEFAWTYRLKDSGSVEVYPTIIKRPEGLKDLWLKLPLRINGGSLSYWYEGRIIKIDKELRDFGISDLPDKCIQENWLYAQIDDASIGLVWPEGTRFGKDRWSLAWEIALDALEEHGQKAPAPLQIYADIFKNAWQLRNYAMGRRIAKPIRPAVELIVNGGNPVLKFPCQAEVIQNLDVDMKASYSLDTSCIAAPKVLSDPLKVELISKIGWELTEQPQQALELIKATVSLPYTDIVRGQLMLGCQGECTLHSQDQKQVYDNGIISFTAARDAGLPGLISLCYKGEEFLDSAYPDYAPKGYFNPFPGGLAIVPYGISGMSLREEAHIVESACLRDQHGNNWTGLAIRTRIVHFEPLRGMEFRQLYLTLPGVPVMALMGEISDHGGRARYFAMGLSLFRKLNNPSQKEKFLLGAKDGSWQSIRHSETELSAWDYCQGLALSSNASPVHLQLRDRGLMDFSLYQDPDMANIQTTLYTRITDKLPQRTSLLFMIFSRELYEQQMLSQLYDLELS